MGIEIMNESLEMERRDEKVRQHLLQRGRDAVRYAPLTTLGLRIIGLIRSMARSKHISVSSNSSCQANLLWKLGQVLEGATDGVNTEPMPLAYPF